MTQVFGVPIRYNASSSYSYAEARGFGKKAHIVVGPLWQRLDEQTQMAILHHEAAHILGRHREIRAIMLAALFVPPLVFLPWNFLVCVALTAIFYLCVQRIAQDQELEADRFAAKNGGGTSLLNFIRGIGPPPNVPYFYPDYERRVGALQRFLEKTQ